MNLNMAMGSDAANASGINQMNMLSHSMASQLLALQSHWAANVAAQGMAISPEQMEQYSQMLSSGPIHAGGNGNGESLAAALRAAPAASPPKQEDTPNSDPGQDPASRKSLMEMMEEDFEPGSVAGDDAKPAADVPTSLNAGVNASVLSRDGFHRKVACRMATPPPMRRPTRRRMARGIDAGHWVRTTRHGII